MEFRVGIIASPPTLPVSPKFILDTSSSVSPPPENSIVAFDLFLSTSVNCISIC